MEHFTGYFQTYGKEVYTMATAIRYYDNGTPKYLLGYFMHEGVNYSSFTVGTYSGQIAYRYEPMPKANNQNMFYNAARAGATEFPLPSMYIDFSGRDRSQIYDLEFGDILVTNRKALNSRGYPVDTGGVAYSQTEVLDTNGTYYYHIFVKSTGEQLDNSIPIQNPQSFVPSALMIFVDIMRGLAWTRFPASVWKPVRTALDSGTGSFTGWVDISNDAWRFIDAQQCYQYFTHSQRAIMERFYTLMNAAILPDNYDYYTSTTGGGGGEYIQDGDLIDETSQSYVDLLNQTGAANTGFVQLFAPSLANVQMLANYMWSTDATLQQLKKVFTDPMDAIITLNQVPISVEKSTSGSHTIKLGYIDTEIPCPICLKEFYKISCGSLTIPEKWGTALDYEPATKVSIYLPFIGTRQLNADDVIGKTIDLYYIINVFECTATAQIKSAGTLKYEFDGNCGARIPLSGGNFSDVYLAIAKSAMDTIAPSMAGAVSAISKAATSKNDTDAAGYGLQAVGELATGIGHSALEIMSPKPTVARGGVTSGTTSLTQCLTPYLIIERPEQALPQHYNEILGYPSHIYSQLSDLHGFTQVEDIVLQNVPATAEEINEIISYLKNGVII